MNVWVSFVPENVLLASNEGDAFALMMLVVIFFSLGMVGLLLWMMKVKSEQRDHEVDALLEELQDSAQREKSAPKTADAAEPPKPPWEKPADWWKTKPDQ